MAGDAIQLSDDDVRRLRSALGAEVEVPDDEWSWLIGRSRIATFDVGELVFAQGRKVDEAYFVLAGMVRYFAVAKASKREVIFGFDYEGRFVADHESLFGGGAAQRSAEAIETVRAVAIRYDVMTAAWQRDARWSIVSCRLYEQLLRRAADKERRIRMLTAEQRYRDLVESGSPLATRLPQYQLAGYLGVAPETLSRIRARM